MNKYTRRAIRDFDWNHPIDSLIEIWYAIKGGYMTIPELEELIKSKERYKQVIKARNESRMRIFEVKPRK